MKVNLSYSVELDEVLAAVEEIQGILSGYQGLLQNHMSPTAPPPDPWATAAPTEGAPQSPDDPADTEEETYTDDD